MRLMGRKINHIIIEVTPEMRKRIIELNEQAMKDSLMLQKYYQ